MEGAMPRTISDNNEAIHLNPNDWLAELALMTNGELIRFQRRGGLSAGSAGRYLPMIFRRLESLPEPTDTPWERAKLQHCI
jgi:hypothetical protein